MDHSSLVWGTVQSDENAGRSELVASWRRCALHHGLDPAGPIARDRLAQQRLRQAREAHAGLISAANPHLDQLARVLLRSGRCLLLSAADGLILEERVGDADREMFAARRLVSGEEWSEAAEGTNGIGTCLADQRRLTIFRDEHFRDANIGVSCTDVPIHGASGELVGALDVSTARYDDDRAMAALMMALLVDASHDIEHRIFQAAHGDCHILVLGPAGPFGPELLAVDPDDLVVGASRAVRRRADLAGVSRQAPVPLPDALGEARADPIQEAERRTLRQALARSNGNATVAARNLGIGRATLYRRMQRTGLAGAGSPAA